MCGYVPTDNDTQLFNHLSPAVVNFDQYLNIKRWWYHMRSFTDFEKSLFITKYPPDILKKCNSKPLDVQVSPNVEFGV